MDIELSPKAYEKLGEVIDIIDEVQSSIVYTLAEGYGLEMDVFELILEAVKAAQVVRQLPPEEIDRLDKQLESEYNKEITSLEMRSPKDEKPLKSKNKKKEGLLN